MFKDRSSPYNRPFNDKKKHKKQTSNALYDLELQETDAAIIRTTIIEKIINFILSIFGKHKEWQEVRTKLKKLQYRIATFEKIIKHSNRNIYNSIKIKDYTI